MFRTFLYFFLNRIRGHGFARMPGVQLLIRVLRRKTAVVHGFTIELDAEDSLGLSLFGTYEPEETALVESIVKPGQFVVDLGACIGYYTLLLSKLVGPTGRVIALEPAPDTCAILRRNIARNGLTNITVVNAAAGESSRPGQLFLSQNRMDYHTESHAGGRSVPIDIIALDDYLQENVTIDFVKMDIQGAEPVALRGMKCTLARSPSVRVLTEYWPDGIRRAGGDPQAFLEHLRSLGFETVGKLQGTAGSDYLYCTKG